MHRVINYDAEVTSVLDILNSGKSAMVGMAFHNAALFGPSAVPPVGNPGTVLWGLACTPTVPTTDMNIHIAPGAIYQLDTVDATAYGDLGTDAAIITKGGILYAAQTLLVSPPTLTAGQSVNILVEVQLFDVDAGSTVVQYYSGNQNPLWGSNFALTQAGGTPQNTTRTSIAKVQLKNGTAATTGSQTTPSVDSGFIGLYVITVPFGFTSILSTYITSFQTGQPANSTNQLLSLPYFPTLPSIPPDVQDSTWTYQADTGALNAMACTQYPLVTSLVAGQMAQVKAAFTNTAATTFNLNGTGAKAVHRATGAALSAGDITAGEIVWLIYDGTAWQIVNFYGPMATAQVNNFNSFSVSYGADHGTPNNILVSPTPAITTLAAGQVIGVKIAPGNTNTNGTTITLPGLPAVPVTENQLSLLPGAITPGEIIILEYDGAVFQKQPQRWPYYPSVAVSASLPDQFLAINDQANISFTAMTSVPLNIACVPGVYSIELIVTINNSTKSDLYLLPNDTSGGSFQAFPTCNVNSSTTSAVSPKSSLVTGSAFPLTMCSSTAGGQDVGPFMLNMVCSTLTTAKNIRFFGGINGGASIGYATWSDLTTAWTSLGTLVVSLSGGSLSPAATMTGVAIVQRLA